MRNYELFKNIWLSAWWLAIKTTSSPDAKTVNTILYKIEWKAYTKAAVATVDLSASTWTLAIPTLQANIVFVTLNAAWTVATYVWTAWDTLAEVKEPEINSWEAIIWRIYIENWTWSAFTIWTTALDTANVTVFYEDCDHVAF